jgi:beta-lactam-binding protein with PASTA domain
MFNTRPQVNTVVSRVYPWRGTMNVLNTAQAPVGQACDIMVGMDTYGWDYANNYQSYAPPPRRVIPVSMQYPVFVTIPSVIGDAEAEAIAALSAVQLAYTFGPAIFSSYPAGTIAAQSPPAGGSVIQGTVVTLNLSLGPLPPPPPVIPAGSVAVPDLIGMFYYDAQLAILEYGLRINTPVWVLPPPGVNPQYVTAQSIAPGTVVAVQTQVTITVAGFTVVNQPNIPTPVP